MKRKQLHDDWMTHYIKHRLVEQLHHDLVFANYAVVPRRRSLVQRLRGRIRGWLRPVHRLFCCVSANECDW